MMFRFRGAMHRVASNNKRLNVTARLLPTLSNPDPLFSKTTTSSCWKVVVAPQQQQHHRAFATLNKTEINKRLDGFQELFVEARMCIEDAIDSAGSTYFEEDSEAAMEAVNEAVAAFDKLIEDVDDDDEKNRILRGNGLKVEQLKGELQLALKGGHDH
mmetsp:Transcript_19571/g.29023  ORF Transcript_19571/g.29023 Transcript_19571/m.29023 type:complete len:158 (-) Transcript_19571:244-717(-)